MAFKTKKQNREYSKKYYRDNLEESRALQQKRTNSFRKKNPLKVRAHWRVGNAIRRGHMKKLPCEICGETKVQAHHDDYSKPLEVRWLCIKHHCEIHDKEIE